MWLYLFVEGLITITGRGEDAAAILEGKRDTGAIF